MIIQTLKINPDVLISLCAVCVSDRSGARIAILIILSSLILLGFANWAWKKYYQKNKEQLSSKK